MKPSFLDNRVTRALLSLALVLGVFVALARAPLFPEPARVGWRHGGSQESISLYPALPEEERTTPDPMPSAFEASAQIDRQQPPEEDQPQSDGEGSEEQVEATVASDSTGSAEEVEGTLEAPLEIFELSGHEPNISGGLGSLYMHVNYPLAARQQGIEGRVILTFIVDEEGYPHDVEVMQSAHPMLDSAAVRAVKQTTFVPGHHNGEPVAVRMRLPVRFQLVSNKRK